MAIKKSFSSMLKDFLLTYHQESKKWNPHYFPSPFTAQFLFILYSPCPLPEIIRPVCFNLRRNFPTEDGANSNCFTKSFRLKSASNPYVSKI